MNPRAIQDGRVFAQPVAIVRALQSWASPWPVMALIAAAWVLAVVAQATGNAAALHHHALISSGGPPLWVAALLSLAGWQVMIAGMMLPASLPAIRAVGASATQAFRSQASSGRASMVAVGVFLAAYAVAWSVAGIAAFLGDAGLHAIVHRSPWLAERPQLIEAALLAVAGVTQLLPTKHRALAACRLPVDRVSIQAVDGNTVGGGTIRDAVRAGARHAIDCVASSWALMLLMFAAGFANLAWMVALTAVMTYEAVGRHGHRAASLAGGVLLVLAIVTLAGAFPL